LSANGKITTKGQTCSSNREMQFSSLISSRRGVLRIADRFNNGRLDAWTTRLAIYSLLKVGRISITLNRDLRDCCVDCAKIDL
jgi:hypothetical protein